MEDFGKCPALTLVQWLGEVGYDCHVGISLKVHEMEIQLWETSIHDEFDQWFRLGRRRWTDGSDLRSTPGPSY
jgi:hypothetical protein